MNDLNKLKEIIEAQQKGLNENEPAYCAGLQLLDIAEREPQTTDILITDLQTTGMNIKAAAEKIKQYADKNHGKAHFFCVTPNKAESILREFYGLPKAEEHPVLIEEDNNLIDIADFIG